MRRREFVKGAAAAAGMACAGPRTWGQGRRRFEARPDGFTLGGAPVVLRSGSMHYPRVPRPYWRERMRWMRALGLNTLCTYVFWNAHEPRPGEFQFDGNLDVAGYVRAAQQEGLHVILRPGPYVCTEWDFGGLPAWLLAEPAARVRTGDARFLAASRRYLRRLGRELARLQVHRGGPIVLVQVENEYGSFGSDHGYVAAIRDQIREAGFDGQLYTADGPSQRDLGGGTLPDLPCAINFGDTDDPAEAFATLKRFRPIGPRMCGEYWDGWFDHWGERHHVSKPAASAGGVDWMLSRQCSFNLYMVHGGTSFGFMAGANFGRTYEPDTTSYDYDAPLDEAGRPTAKFHALRAVIGNHLQAGESLPALPPVAATASLPRFSLPESAALAQLLDAGNMRRARQPLPLEALHQNYGWIWYRTRIAAAQAGQLVIPEVRDYARVYQNGRELGRLDRSLGEARLGAGIAVALKPGWLDIVVECMGRINFGSRLQDNLQGIPKPVTLAGRELVDWEMFPLPLDAEQLRRLRFAASAAKSGPMFFRGRFAAGGADTFLDMRGWSKGQAWVNGHNLGRFWNRGPQQALYLPGCWLQPSGNEALLLDWDAPAQATLAGVGDPVYLTP